MNGASLVQLYSALVYHGLELVTDIKEDLARRLRKDGFTHVSDAVGAAFPEISGRRAPADEAREAKAAVKAAAKPAKAEAEAAKPTPKKPTAKTPSKTTAASKRAAPKSKAGPEGGATE